MYHFGQKENTIRNLIDNTIHKREYENIPYTWIVESIDRIFETGKNQKQYYHKLVRLLSWIPISAYTWRKLYATATHPWHKIALIEKAEKDDIKIRIEIWEESLQIGSISLCKKIYTLLHNRGVDTLPKTKHFTTILKKENDDLLQYYISLTRQYTMPFLKALAHKKNLCTEIFEEVIQNLQHDLELKGNIRRLWKLAHDEWAIDKMEILARYYHRDIGHGILLGQVDTADHNIKQIKEYVDRVLIPSGIHQLDYAIILARGYRNDKDADFQEFVQKFTPIVTMKFWEKNGNKKMIEYARNCTGIELSTLVE